MHKSAAARFAAVAALLWPAPLWLARFSCAAELPLMPWPAEVVQGHGALRIDSAFRIRVESDPDLRLERALQRLLTRISRQSGLQFSGNEAQAAVLTIHCRAGSPHYPPLNENESYTLDVSPSGARIEAPAVTGALRALETFGQLITPGADGAQALAVHIADRPRFAWRGLMLDVSRHWMPPAVIERNLDAMAAVKLNVLHWHLTDDQGFRVESRKFPRLQQFGSDGHFYTQDEIRRVIAHARDVGIRVIPEFDMPGHATSWVVGYPELASAPGPYRIERRWGVFDPVLDPARESTYAFLDAFLGEMAALFPDPYFHIGGDEVEDKQWLQSAAIQAFAKEHKLKNSHDLQAYFNQRVEKLLEKHGKVMIGWDEVLHPGVAPGTVIQSWRGQDSLAAAARKGYRGILSFGYYLDHLKPAAFHYGIDPLDGAAGNLDPAQAERVLGGEACMWSEYVSSETVDSRIWPRAAAIAERLWSPRNIKDVESMYARMGAVSRTLEWVGVQHRSNYARMLDEAAGTALPGAVRVVVDAVEALGIEGRRDARKYTSLVALNRLVDAARVESETIRYLERCAARLSGNRPALPEQVRFLRATFTNWSRSYELLPDPVTANLFWGELIPISEELSAVGAIGLRTLEYLENGSAPADAWVSEQSAALAAMEKPKAEVVLAAVRPVRLLLEAARSRRGLKKKEVRPVTNLPVTGPQPL